MNSRTKGGDEERVVCTDKGWRMPRHRRRGHDRSRDRPRNFTLTAETKGNLPEVNRERLRAILDLPALAFPVFRRHVFKESN